VIDTITSEGNEVKTTCQLMGASRAGFYHWKDRPMSASAIRDVWLTDTIIEVHAASRGTYGSPRVHAELRLGREIVVARKHVARLMQQAGIAGLPLKQRFKKVSRAITSADLVERSFERSGPDQLWVTDITEHRTREGKIFCCVVLDAHSRRVVGWSIDSAQTATLTTNALTMAIENRRPAQGLVIHSDHDTQGGFNWSSQHLDQEVDDGKTSRVDAGVDWTLTDEVAGPSLASSRGAARVLETGRHGNHERGRCSGRRGVPGGRDALVSPRWWNATDGSERTHRPLPVFR
jgi:transposase InsO family protein